MASEDLHLTPVSSLVHLRPQLHHIDATTQQERQASSAASKEGTGGAAGPARAIHMTIKTTADGDTVTTETMADRLRYVQSEPWRKLRYTDENEESAWEIYNESLFLRSQTDSETPAAETATGGGGGDEKGKEVARDDAEAERPLEESFPHYGINWDDTKYLEAISGIKKPEPEEPEPEKAKEEPKPQLPVTATPTPAAEEPRRPKMRPRGGSSIGTRRGGR